MQNTLDNLDFLHPGDSVKPIGRGDDHADYLLSSVLASYGCVVRDLSLHGFTAEIRVYKCAEGKRYNGYQFEISPIDHNVTMDSHLEEYFRRFRHSRDLILRYPRNVDGSLGFPKWHSIFSGIHEISHYKDYRFTLLPVSYTPLYSDSETGLSENSPKDDVVYGAMVDVIASLRYNGIAPKLQSNRVLFSIYGDDFAIYIHDETLILEGLFVPAIEQIDLARFNCAHVWIGGHEYVFGEDKTRPKIKLAYELQENEKDLLSLLRLIPQMTTNMHNAFERMMEIYGKDRTE